MTTSDAPVWLIAAGDIEPSQLLTEGFPGFDGALTPKRVSQLRDAMAAFLDLPLLTLEAHPLPPGSPTPSGGRLLEAASPLARHLGDLVRSTPVSSGGATAAQHGETLYRMVVPSSLAGQLGDGLLQSMRSNAIESGIHSGIHGAKGLVGHATFVPVVSTAGKAGSGTPAAVATVGATATAGGAAAGAAVITVAAPLVILAVATAASIYAEEQRRKAIERVTDMLKDLQRNELDRERDQLSGCAGAIEKATAVLLDEGPIGHSLGLDSAVNAIDTAIATARRRVTRWQERLNAFPQEGVEAARVMKAFPGIEVEDGEFRIKLRLIALAVALKRRVAVLQAVDHSQRSPEKAFLRFARSLKQEQDSVDELEASVGQLLRGLAQVQLRSPERLVDHVMFRGEVNDLLRWQTMLRRIAETEGIARAMDASSVDITMIRQTDGQLRVLPPRATEAS